MAFEPKRPPGGPGASGEPVQLQPGEAAIPEDWLSEPEHAGLADKVDRLAGDVEVVMLLALSNYEGDRWDVFATELAKYGMAVIGGWMHKGLIHHKCRAKGFGLPELGRPFEPDEITELTSETVAKALYHFRRDVLLKRKWDSTRGATLRTYFVGQCIIRFANIYRHWWGNESRFRQASRSDDHELLNELGGVRTDDFQRAAAHRDEIERCLAEVKDDRVKHAMLLTAAGRSQAEIADLLDCTEKTVERMLYNERQRQRKRRAG
ncbi:hypothetical protein KM427_16120 [Nocardioides sp. LMS-CY]|uniref:hypothetical protein n=1 Tax=Nocardioides sp. (strain LMS-CY) TaxID=2840457 RepID=UPI001C0000E4|nr:hypothetical protein [Nocardioides sp. LMS-CY]QWF20504.1 hypothetical protein KM427_16120 [Nocardioides sp. LMS-CY]